MINPARLSAASARKMTMVDPDLHRRAAVSYALQGDGWRVEPLESVAELMVAPPSAGILLVADEGELLAAVLDCRASAVAALPVIAFSASPEPRRVVNAIHRGASGYLEFPFSASDLADAVLHTLSGDQGARHDALDRLTARERQVLDAAANGMTSRTIGKRLSISRRTVDAHRQNLLTKLGKSTMREAVSLTRGLR